MRLRCIWGAVLGVLFCTLSFAVYSQEGSATKQPASPIKVAGIPAGFQFLLEKQTTAVDIFFGDVYLTTTLASYTPTTVEFHNPPEIVNQLNNLLTPEQVAQALTGQIDSHVGEVCYRQNDPDCGVITPDEVGVIFDEGKFRADIFINPSLLTVQQINFNRFLSPSESEFSYITNLSYVHSGGGSSDDKFSLSGQSLFSWQEQRVIGKWWFGDDGRETSFKSDTLYWQKDDKDFQYQAGWFNSESGFLTFLPTLNILGFRYSTSLKARVDLRYSSGSEVQLFLANRSRINILKDGRILSSKFYNPGIQVIDTAILPDGAYDIELRITDQSGREEVQTQYFVKSQRLAPLDQDLFFFELGDVQESVGDENDFPESKGEGVVMGGYSHRISKSLGLNAGAALSADSLVMEGGIYYVKELFDVEPKLLLGSEGEFGFSVNGFFRYEQWSGSYQFRKLWGENKINSDSGLLSQTSLSQHVLGLNRAIFAGQFRFKYSFSERAGTESNEVVSLSYLKPLSIPSLYGRLNLSTELTQDNDDTRIQLRLNWNWGIGKFNHSANARIVQNNSNDETDGSKVALGYSGGWRDKELYPEDILVNWGVSIDDDDTIVNLDGGYNSYLGAARLSLNYRDLEHSTGVIYSAEASTSVAGENDTWGMGGKTANHGALVLYIEKDGDQDRLYDVFINRGFYGAVKSSQQIVVPVAPYGRYDVTVNDRGNDLASFERQTKSVTIYPGNVKAFSWAPRSVGVLVGQVLRLLPGCFDEASDECWDPLVFGTAMEVNDRAITDGDGYIQTEVFKNSKSFIMRKQGQYCKVDLTGMDFSGGLAYAENGLKCYPDEGPQIKF